MSGPLGPGGGVGLFVYGTLRPGAEAWEMLAPHVVGTASASVRGVLFDTGLGYPALVTDHPVERPAPVPGLAVGVHPDRAASVLARLDAYEEVDVGMYVRVPVPLEGGGSAWVWLWELPTDGMRRIAAWPPAVGGPPRGAP